MKSGLLSRPAGMMTKSIATLCAATFLLQPIAAIAADTTSYTYDEARSGAFNAGQLTSVSNAAATIRYDHDQRGNVTSQRWEVDGTTYTQTFTYAPHDQVLRRTFADGDAIPSASGTYQYDGAGLLKSIPGLINNISYNANFDPVTTTYGNGVTETRAYDPNRQWLMSITASTGSSTLFEESYTRSNRGLITDVASNRANGDWQYGYDTADRLTSATNLNSSDYTQTFQYDVADNIINNSSVGSYTYPAPTALRPHAVTQAGSHIYSYDSNGNMTAGAGRTIDYDGENRPISITYNGQTTTFIYGPDGARLKKVSGGNTTLYLGADEEITSDGTHIKHPLADVRKSGTDINWLHRDHLSSVKLMSDAAGAVIAENFYRPYGERSDEQSPVSVPRESKGWIGERDDPETGLTYLNARYYDPVLSRFVSPDWFEPTYPGVETNRYAYALNNPIWLKDPSGNTPFDIFESSGADANHGGPREGLGGVYESSGGYSNFGHIERDSDGASGWSNWRSRHQQASLEYYKNYTKNRGADNHAAAAWDYTLNAIRHPGYLIEKIDRGELPPAALDAFRYHDAAMAVVLAAAGARFSLGGRKKFGDLSDHYGRHGQAAGMTKSGYLTSALAHIERNGAQWTGKFRHNGMTKLAHVSPLGVTDRKGEPLYAFTSSSLSRQRVFTHMPEGVTTQYLSNLGIRLPKGM